MVERDNKNGESHYYVKVVVQRESGQRHVIVCTFMLKSQSVTQMVPV